MKRRMIGALLGAQLLTAAQPAMAAEVNAVRDTHMGAFGGVRIRLPLDGDVRDRQLRAGLTVAPTLQSRMPDGETRLRIGEGLEFGVRGSEPARLSFAGRDLRRLAAQSGDGDDDGGGLPTGAWIAGGIVLVAIGAVVFAAITLENASDD